MDKVLNKKIEIAIIDCNKVIEKKNKFIEYFKELDLYKEGKKNKLTSIEIEKIEKIGFTNYCNDLIDKFCKFSGKFDIVVSYLINDLNINIPDYELLNGIPIEKYTTTL